MGLPLLEKLKGIGDKQMERLRKALSEVAD
jgi:hypothetical protein